MDNRPNLHESLFSRNSTPPSSQQAQHPFSPQHISNNSSPSLIDSLFQGISPPAPDHQSTLDSHPSEIYDSASLAPGAPLPPDEPVNSQSASNSSTATERQNALLSLLSGGPPPAPRPQPVAQPPQNLPQQVPTPPGSSSQRSNASPQQTETQKILDQIMGGTTSRSTTYSDTQRSNPQAPSPPYTRDDFRSFQPHDHSAETSPRARPLQHPPQAPPPPQQQQQQQQPPSPRRSMFEFTSPFDHLSSSTGSIKKKAVPPQPSNVSSGNEDSSWTSVTDPKRQSMENLLENLTRGQPQQTQPQPPAYESYLSSDYSQGESAPIRAPLPPIPASKPVSVPIPIPNVTGSPRGGSPKGQPLHRPQPRAAEVNNSQQAPYPGSGGRRDKDSSPGPRGRGGAPRAGQPGLKFSKPRSPSPQSQTIIFDVSLPLEEILARDAVKSTAIALVRQDSVFLPGTTIGATHWVAYAMTRGRVRVISRSSGDRTLLQLPQIFSQASSVIDMAVYVNRLAGVTSDGGFVVWELPELITDDVPGRILLCVPPTNDSDAIRAVKWHPKDPDTLAIASDNQIYVIDLANTHALHGQPLPHSDLHHIGQPFNVPSTVVAFDFDVVHHALATISEDSSLTIWNMHDSLPYAVHKIRGEDIPSSLTFVDGGIVVGRRNGTIFQLLSMTNKSILSTIKFINSAQEDPDMFGHISYDSRIQTLWVANSRRESLIALKVHIEPSFATGEESVRGWIEQVAEFTGIKPTIHFVILTADADPHGDEALAACVAAKVPPGELVLVAFSVHSSGVDQVLIRREWFDQALASAESKLPPIDISTPYMPPLDNKPQLQRAPLPMPPAMSQPSSVQFAPPRNRTPPSDDVDNEFGSGDQKGRGVKGKNVNWKEKEEINKDKASKSTELSIVESSALGQALTKEMKKTEDNLHNRIGRLINKEMDKQHQRLEEARLHEQAEDFARQEKILKLISTELTRNTTRVVEMAVKTEIQNSVLPALETMTKTELKTAFNEQVATTLADLVSRQLPPELEKSLLRSSISNHYAGLLSSNLAPAIERQIKEILTTNFFQFHAQQTASMQQDLTRELRSELSLMKSEFAKWHSESLRNHETTIRELEHTVRALSEQVKYLSMNAPPPILHHLQPTQQPQNSPGGPPPQLQANLGPSHLRQANIPPVNAPTGYTQTHPAQFQQPPPQQQQPPVQPWYNTIAAPQASHPATIPQPPPSAPQPDRTPPIKPDQWDEIYLGVLHSQDQTKLRDLLLRTNPDLVLPLNGPPLVSQAVILTLIHRLSAVVGDTAPGDEAFKTSLWWLQRVASLLRPDDKLIADFIPRVIPTVQSSLNTTKQRLAILPGGSATMETARALSDVQEALRRKVAS